MSSPSTSINRETSTPPTSPELPQDGTPASTIRDVSTPPTSPETAQDGAPMIQSMKRKAKAEESDFEDSDSEDDGPSARAPPAKRARGTAVPVYNQNRQSGRPLPIGPPPAWGHSRQQMCEAIPWFRAHQQGAYTSGGIVHGLLIAGEVGIRDVFGTQKIITTIGGGRKLAADGTRAIDKNQDEGTLVKTWKETMLRKLPVGVLAGQNHFKSPTQLPHYYCVLGWFHVTDVWCEIRGQYQQWICCLEKTDLDEPSWWAPSLKSTLRPQTIVNPERQKCPHCYESSPAIFAQGWVCLNPQCLCYYEGPHTGDLKLISDQVEYSQAYLDSRTPYQGEAPGPLTRTPDFISSLTARGETGYEFIWTQGIVCPKCQCCSRRIHDWGWRCENQACNFELRARVPTITVQDAMPDKFTPNFHKIVSVDMNKDNGELGPKDDPKIMEPPPCPHYGGYDIEYYDLPGPTLPNGRREIAGIIVVFRATPAINARADGPDQLFRELQEEEHLGMKRNRVRGAEGGVTEGLTNHLSRNYGTPYKFKGMNGDELPFYMTPSCFLKALVKMTWAGQTAASHLGRAPTADGSSRFEMSFEKFNELLAVGYFETQSMNWHDDGEKDVGNTIASLSLGGAARFHARPKKYTDIGGKPLPKGSTCNKPVSFTVPLYHGDIMIQHGSGIQKYYEHKVEPTGRLRYALTSRFLFNREADAEQREFNKTAAKMPENFDYEYSGEPEPVPGAEKQFRLVQLAAAGAKKTTKKTTKNTKKTIAKTTKKPAAPRKTAIGKKSKGKVSEPTLPSESAVADQLTPSAQSTEPAVTAATASPVTPKKFVQQKLSFSPVAEN